LFRLQITEECILSSSRMNGIVPISSNESIVERLSYQTQARAANGASRLLPAYNATLFV
jgi:hypothetical protein